MRYVEVPIKEAMKICKENATVLVAEQDLEKDDCDIVFVIKGKNEYDAISLRTKFRHTTRRYEQDCKVL